MEIKDARRKLYSELVKVDVNANGCSDYDGVITIYLKDGDNIEKVPLRYEGFPVKAKIIGEIKSFGK